MGIEAGLIVLSVAVALAGWWLARHYALTTWPGAARALARRMGPLYRLSFYRWWWDDFYMHYVAGGLWVFARVANWLDRWIIDGLLHTIARIAWGGSRIIRALQNGQVQAYALAVLLGVNVVIWLILWGKAPCSMRVRI